jgi:hypothetical protein
VKEGRLLALAAAAVVVVALAGAVLLGSEGSADASSLSRASGGWLAARRYLEEKGTPVALVDHALDEPVGRGVLVLAFPWQRFALDDVGAAVTRHLQQGGAVVLAYTADPGPGESAIGDALGLVWQDRRPRPPLRPRRWWAYASEEWSLRSDPPDARGDVRTSALRRAPAPPAGAAVLLRDGQGRALAFSFARFRGRVAVVPADAFTNARLGHPGNADLLERLRVELVGPTWLFDEFHHGLRAAVGPEAERPQRVLLLYMLQVAFVYALCALAVARRFGPAWRETAVPGGSAAAFLMGLGAWHDRLGHHPQAARLLVERARELDPRVVLTMPPVDDGRGLLAVAQSIGARQSGRDRSE